MRLKELLVIVDIKYLRVSQRCKKNRKKNKPAAI
jgi:hypothetical protein